VRADEVVTGCGSDDVLDSTIRAFAEPGDRIAYPDPTFGMLPLFARMNGLEAVAVPMRSPHELDVDALLATRARVIYVCSPNNPTGVSTSPAQIDRLVEHAAGVVIIDEAYAEFSGAGWIAKAPSHPRLVVARTMSKAFGLAGLRIGYATAAAPLAIAIEKARGPYMIGTVAERAALAALRDDVDWMRARARDVAENRAKLTRELRALGMQPLESTANFVFVPVIDAALVAANMRAAGVAVRPFSAVHGVGDGIRITVGPWPMMETAIAALRDAVSQ
jgi:histidinol-phosphate aminotransferase